MAGLSDTAAWLAASTPAMLPPSECPDPSCSSSPDTAPPAGPPRRFSCFDLEDLYSLPVEADDLGESLSEYRWWQIHQQRDRDAAVEEAAALSPLALPRTSPLPPPMSSLASSPSFSSTPLRLSGDQQQRSTNIWPTAWLRSCAGPTRDATRLEQTPWCYSVTSPADLDAISVPGGGRRRQGHSQSRGSSPMWPASCLCSSPYAPSAASSVWPDPSPRPDPMPHSHSHRHSHSQSQSLGCGHQSDKRRYLSHGWPVPHDGRPEPEPDPDPQLQLQLQPQPQPAGKSHSRTFKPMQMVHRERWGGGRRGGRGTSSLSSSMQMPLSLSLSMSLSSSPSSPPMRHPLSLSLSSSSSSSSPPALELSVEEQLRRRMQGISLNYRGDIDNPHNRGDHVPDHQNTSLFLTNLPADADVADLLRAIAALGPTGRIFSASVNAPDPARGHRRAAAKVSFFTRAQAERLKLRIDAGELLMASSTEATDMMGFGVSEPKEVLRVRAIWNRDKKAPRCCIQPNECRVLRICGPAAIVNYEALTAYFAQKFYYELEDVAMLPAPAPEPGQPVQLAMEWRFASFQSQAIAAKMALNHEKKMVTVEYGRDPCE